MIPLCIRDWNIIEDWKTQFNFLIIRNPSSESRKLKALGMSEWTNERTALRSWRKFITKWNNNTKLIHIFNWIMIMNYKTKRKIQIHFSSTFQADEELWGGGRRIENSNSSRRKWKMESFSICLWWKVSFFSSFFFISFSSGYALLKLSTNHKLKTYWH